MSRETRLRVFDHSNRRIHGQDGSLHQQNPENVPSHKCLILGQSFEALKSARSSTDNMKRVQRGMETAAGKEGEKNELYQKKAESYARFSEEIDDTAHGMNSVTPICTENESLKQAKENGNEIQIDKNANTNEVTKQI